MSPEVYKFSKCFSMLEIFISDHSGMCMVFRVRSAVGVGDRAAHVCRARQCVNKLVLRWKPERALAYACNIVSNAEVMKQFDEAEKDKRVDVLAFCIRSLIVQAASSREVGMSAPARCPLMRERKRKGPLSPVWFDAECSEKRSAFRDAVKRGEAVHACQFLKKESARTNRRKKHWYTRRLCCCCCCCF